MNKVRGERSDCRGEIPASPTPLVWPVQPLQSDLSPLTSSLSYNRLVHAAARFVSGYLIAALSVAGITLVGYRWLHLNPTPLALAFLFGILGISASWGLRQAVFMSVIATLPVKYWSRPPSGTFTTAHPQNWTALFAWLVT